MDKLLVKDWMTGDPITVDTTNNLSTAYHLMRMNSVRRLPVLDEAEHLVGIVTWGDIREARPKASASMTMEPTWEIHFLAGIRGVGTGVAQAIIAEREAGGPFKTLHDFVERVDSSQAKRCS